MRVRETAEVQKDLCLGGQLRCTRLERVRRSLVKGVVGSSWPTYDIWVRCVPGPIAGIQLVIGPAAQSGRCMVRALVDSHDGI